MIYSKKNIDLSLHILCPCFKNVFTHPVILPCGKSVCKFHVNESLIRSNSQSYYNCIFCKKEHQTDENDSFPSNKTIDFLIKTSQGRATSFKEIHKNANESYNKFTSN